MNINVLKCTHLPNGDEGWVILRKDIEIIKDKSLIFNDEVLNDLIIKYLIQYVELLDDLFHSK